MTVTQSNDVNTLLRWAMDVPRAYGGGVVTSREAMEAAARLADAANKRLSAGLDGKSVRRMWSEQPPLGTDRPAAATE